MQKNRFIIWGTLLTTLLLSGLALTLPTPLDWPTDGINFHQQFIINIFMACTHIGGATLFLANLDVYKKALRRAYIILSIGTLFIGLGTLQIVTITLFGGWDAPYSKSGATVLPFFLSGVILYASVRAFARLVGVTHPLAKVRIALPLIFTLTALTVFLPHANNPKFTEAAYDVFVILSIWPALFMVTAAIVLVKIRSAIGTLYVPAITWLTRALIFGGVVFFYLAFYTLVDTGFNPYLTALSNTISVLSGFLWIRAGYAFALTKYFNRNIPLLRFLVGATAISGAGSIHTVVDMVTNAASLASNSRDIDPMLDKMRSITAALQPGQSPTGDSYKTLIATYLQIEEYLVTKEVIRSYTRSELRSLLSPELRELLASHSKTASKQ